MRQKAFGALLAVALISGIVAVAPASAAANSPVLRLSGEGSAASGELIVKPIAPTAPGAPIALSGSCGGNQVCAWSGIFSGSFSAWSGEDTGCHNHKGNPELRSGVNNSKYRERVGGWGYVEPNHSWETAGGAVTGELCWPA